MNASIVVTGLRALWPIVKPEVKKLVDRSENTIDNIVYNIVDSFLSQK